MSFLWAKTDRDGGSRWHPLLLHLLDVAASAEAILAREPEATRVRMGDILGMPWEQAKPWLLLVIACHDLGKACPGFQAKWPEIIDKTGLNLPANPNTRINHGYVSGEALKGLLTDVGWPSDLAQAAADAVGSHHGERASQKERNQAFYEVEVGRGQRCSQVRAEWKQARRLLFDTVKKVLEPKDSPTRQELQGPDYMLLAGLTSFADWIGSNENWFPFGTSDECAEPKEWISRRRKRAESALDELGWQPRTPIASQEMTFKQIFNLPPRPLQSKMEEVVKSFDEPGIILIEAPMGEGKTEAAFHAHLELQRKFGHRGLYVALPTKATGNAMFERLLGFLEKRGADRAIDVQLVHGAKLLSESFQRIRMSGVHDEKPGGEIRAAMWFSNKKRALLSEYGVGTVDQALLPILPVRHYFVRLWGLANRVVVFDEIHAYDAYTGTLLIQLVRWLLSLGSTIILLSATLPREVRKKLAEAAGASLPDHEASYPRISIFKNGGVEQKEFQADPARSIVARLCGVPPEPAHILQALNEHLPEGGLALALMNTVQRAQDLFCHFPAGTPLERGGIRVGKKLEDGTEVYLFHARYPADSRQEREQQALEAFGAYGSRKTRKILVATQVAEQSLDLDFDLVLTDLAPIDLVLQRAGRLWRHQRTNRSMPEPLLLVAGLDTDTPISFGKPLWWNAVYREDILLRTFVVLQGKRRLSLPDEIDLLVRAVYQDEVEIPEEIRERFEKADQDGEGSAMAEKIQANQSFIGRPDDASWDNTSQFVLYDEDEAGVHRTIMAQTRLGEESIEVVPVQSDDELKLEDIPDFERAKDLYLRSLRVTRKNVVHKLKAVGVPSGWERSTLLRNCHPLLLDHLGRWVEDTSVRMDEDLGLFYEPKEDG